jgi:hypothetical protein
MYCLITTTDTTTLEVTTDNGTYTTRQIEKIVRETIEAGDKITVACRPVRPITN